MKTPISSKKITVAITIQSPLEKVWDYLTKPELIKTYLFGTDTETDWKVGSRIYFRGTWEGKKYEDKGTVLEFQPKQHLAYLHWSSFSGLPDVPENYQRVAYDLQEESNQTTVTVTSDCPETNGSAERCETSWRQILETLKKQIE